MDESKDAERPPNAAPRYLPRTWKAEPEPEPEPPVIKKKKKGGDARALTPGEPKSTARAGKKPRGGKARAAAEDGANGPRGALVEETPALDTYQARQTARIITGLVLAAIACLFVLVIYWTVGSYKDEETAADEALLAQTPSHDPAQAEREARFMMHRARDVARRGNAKLAVLFLKKINAAYPQTTAASDAAIALEGPVDRLAARLDQSSGLPTGPSPPRAPTGPSPPLARGPALPTKADRHQDAAPAGPQVALAPSVPAPPSGPQPPPPGTVPSGPNLAPAASTGPVGLAPAEGTSAAGSMPAAPAGPPLAVAANTPVGLPVTKPLPSGFHPAPGAAVSPAGWPVQIVCERDGATMVLVPGGDYRMGRDDGEVNERPGHHVILSTYYIDQHEVTVRQFDAFQKQDGQRSERTRAVLKLPSPPSDSDDAPVTMVTARDAKDYATWAGKQLPTEAQWEVAARSSDGRLYPWGHDEPQWDKPRAFRKIEPVRSHPRDVSPFGAFDMAGNAWEWTKDWYDGKYYTHFRDVPAENPVGPPRPKSEQLTVRGCSRTWSITQREGLRWGARLPYVGFRCVLQAEQPAHVTGVPASGNRPASGGAAAEPMPF